MRSLLFFLMIPLFSWSQDDLKTISSYMDYLDNSFYDYNQAGIDSITIYKCYHNLKDSKRIAEFYLNENDVVRLKYFFEQQIPFTGNFPVVGDDSVEYNWTNYELLKENNGYKYIVPRRFFMDGVYLDNAPGVRFDKAFSFFSRDKLIAEEKLIGSNKEQFIIRHYNYFEIQDGLYRDTIDFIKSEYRYTNGNLKEIILYDYHIDKLKKRNIEEEFPEKDYIPFFKNVFSSDSIDYSPSKYVKDEFPLIFTKHFVLIFFNSKYGYLPIDKLKKKYRKRIQEEFTIYQTDFNSKEPVPQDQVELDSYQEGDSTYYVGLINTKGEKMRAIMNFDETKVKNGFIGYIFNSQYELVFRLDKIEDFVRFFNSDASEHILYSY